MAAPPAKPAAEKLDPALVRMSLTLADGTAARARVFTGADGSPDVSARYAGAAAGAGESRLQPEFAVPPPLVSQRGCTT
jgi:hypothetical protein